MNRSRTRSLAIARPIDDVFAALTEAASLNGWFARGVHIVPKLGGRFAFEGIDGPSDGMITSFAPPHALAFTLTANEEQSTASFSLSVKGGGIVVALTLAVEEENEEAVGLAADWVCLTLYNLRDFLETGRLCWEAEQADGVTTSIQVHAGPGDAFAALIEPERLRRWLSQHSHVDTQQSLYSYGWTEGGAPAGPAKILDLEPGVRLLHDWYYPDDGHSQVEWKVEGQGGATIVKLTHTGLEPEHSVGYLRGWSVMLYELKAYLEDAEVAAAEDSPAVD